MRVRAVGSFVLVVAVFFVFAGVASASEVIRTIPVGEHPEGVSSDGTHVWVTNVEENTVSEIDASTGNVIKTIPVGRFPFGVSSDGTHVWVANAGDHTVSEIEASTGNVIKTIPVGVEPGGVSSDGTHVWVTNAGDQTVSEIEASTGNVIKTIPVGVEPGGVSSDGTDVWVSNYAGGTVSEIEASTGNVIKTIPVGGESIGVSSDGTDVWVANDFVNTVSEIEASTGNVIKTIPVGVEPEGVSSDGTHVWVANLGENTVSEIEASTGNVINTISVGNGPIGVSSDGTHVWVTNAEDNTVSEIEIASPPTAEIKSPTTGGTYQQGEVIHTMFSCEEGAFGPGIETCSDEHGVPSSEEGALETTMLGAHTYTVTATSEDMLQGTAMIEYTVVPAVASCTSASGKATFLKSGTVGHLLLRDHLNTSPAGTLHLRYIQSGSKVVLSLLKLEEASCSGAPGEHVFTGSGPAVRQHNHHGYTLNFSIREEGGHFFFKGELMKGSQLIEPIGGPLKTKNQKIS